MIEKLVKVKNFPNRMLAEHAQQALEQEGISSMIQSPSLENAAIPYITQA